MSHVDTSASFLAPTESDLLHEEAVLRNPSSVKTWWRFIQDKRNLSSNARDILYERAIRHVPGSYKLWIAYLRERRIRCRDRCIDDREWEKLTLLYQRAVVFLSKMPVLWIEYLKHMCDQGLITDTRLAFDNALRSLPVTQHDRIWPLYMEWAVSCTVAETAVRIFRRYFKFDPSHVEVIIDHLVNLERWNDAAMYLEKSLNDPSFTSSKGRSRHVLWMELCDMLAKHPNEITSIVHPEAVIRNGIREFSDEVGRLWCSLAQYLTRLGLFERARDVYEEAISGVATVRDFSMCFDAYALFEESLISELMADDDKTETDEGTTLEIDLRLARLERLMDRRPLLLSSVMLRQNPHNVHEWHRRVKLMEHDPRNVVHTFSQALTTIDPNQAVGKVFTLWCAFAKFYESHNDYVNARAVFEKAVSAGNKFKNIEDIARLYCEYAEFEIRVGEHQSALNLIQRALVTPSSAILGKRKKRKNINYRIMDDEKREEKNESEDIFMSTRLWCLLTDLEESFGNGDGVRSAYDRALDVGAATPQMVLNYADYLESHRYFDDAFRAYEKGVQCFRFPYSSDIWICYLTKFVRRFGNKKIERARDLFEQCVTECPSDQVAPFFLLYATLEEEYGLTKHAMEIYERATKIVTPPAVNVKVYNIYIHKATEFYGAPKTRSIYEAAIGLLPDTYSRVFALRWACLERRLGEIDRARHILIHASQMCDPNITSTKKFWYEWKQFEIAHGNEETFKEMLRMKRTLAVKFSNMNYNSDLGAQALKAVAFARGQDNVTNDSHDDANPSSMSTSNKVDVMDAVEELVLRKENGVENPDEINLDDEDEDDDKSENDDDDSHVSKKRHLVSDEIEEKQVPAAVFGSLASSMGQGMGALERLRLAAQSQGSS